MVGVTVIASQSYAIFEHCVHSFLLLSSVCLFRLVAYRFSAVCLWQHVSVQVPRPICFLLSTFSLLQCWYMHVTVCVCVCVCVCAVVVIHLQFCLVRTLLQTVIIISPLTKRTTNLSLRVRLPFHRR